MTRKVLIVDDTATDRVAVSNVLKQYKDVVLVEAINGQSGFDMAKQHKPDLIIMDIVMPQVSGFESLRLLKSDAETKGIPVFLLTTKAQESDKFRGKQLGAAGYMTKPVKEAEFRAMVGSLLA